MSNPKRLNIKPLNELELKAASLLAEGHTEHEVASLCNRSRSWVQALKRRTDFQSVFQKLKENTKSVEDTSPIQPKVEAIVDVSATPFIGKGKTKEEFSQDIYNFQIRLMNLGNKFLTVSEKLLSLYEQKIDQIDPADISLNRLASDLKSLSTFSEVGHLYILEVAGLQKIAQVLQKAESRSQKK